VLTDSPRYGIIEVQGGERPQSSREKRDQTMKIIERVSKGGYVQADTLGTGDWEVGKITDFDAKHVWFQSAADMQIVKIRRKEAFKATAQDYSKASEVEADGVEGDLTEEEEVLEGMGQGDEGEADEGEADEGEADEEEVEKSRSIVKKSYKKRYHKVKVGGRTTQNCGDLVSEKLLGETLEEVYDTVAETLEEDVDNLAARYEHLNPGQQRMVLGNKLRAFYKTQAEI
jgi:hypothetical protein